MEYSHVVTDLSAPRSHYIEGWKPALRLKAGLDHRIPDWIDSSFKTLLGFIPAGLIIADDINTLGGAVFSALLNTHTDIDKHRRQLAFAAPRFHSPDACTKPKRCQAAWDALWSDAIAKLLCHPDEPVSDRVVLDRVRLNVGKFEDFCSHCHEAVLAVMEKDDRFDQEQLYIRKYLDRLRA